MSGWSLSARDTVEGENPRIPAQFLNSDLIEFHDFFLRFQNN